MFLLSRKKKNPTVIPPPPCCPVMDQKYQTLRVLGAGSQGVVVLCKDRATGALVACKTSQAHYPGPPCKKKKTSPLIKSMLSKMLTRKKVVPHDSNKVLAEVSDLLYLDAIEQNNVLKHEIEMMHRACGHPNMLSSHSTFESADGRFLHLITPFCDKGSLLDMLDWTPSHMPKPLLDDGRAAKVIASIASALSHCHARGIVHRDVKLGNIFVCTKQGRAGTFKQQQHSLDDLDVDFDCVLGDFGTAATLAPGRKLSHFTGTIMYMAPEIKRTCGYDQGVDVWSLGVVLHVLLSGSFLGEDRRPHHSIYDYQALDLLLGMLCCDPAKRFTIEQVLSHPWIVKSTEDCKLAAGKEANMIQSHVQAKIPCTSAKQVLALWHAKVCNMHGVSAVQMVSCR